jgi:hypothetical protein
MTHVLQDGGVHRTVPQASRKVNGIDEQGEKEEEKHLFLIKKEWEISSKSQTYRFP